MSEAVISLEEVRRRRELAREREPELLRARHRLIEDFDGDYLAGYKCACGLWSLKMRIGEEVAHHVAARDIIERHRGHVESGAANFELGYGVKCLPFKAKTNNGQITTGIICGAGRDRKRCQVCKKSGAWSVAQCDYPIGGLCKKCKGSGVDVHSYSCHPCAGTGLAMCNKHLCDACRFHPNDDEDFCDEHRVAAGYKQKVRREEGVWRRQPPINNRKCWRQSCETHIDPNEMVLFFERTRRAMCMPCGKEYEILFLDEE